MTRTFTNSLAAVAAVILTITSIGSIVAVPDNSMLAAHSAMPVSELA